MPWGTSPNIEISVNLSESVLGELTKDGAMYLKEGVRGNVAAGKITIDCQDVTDGEV